MSTCLPVFIYLFLYLFFSLTLCVSLSPSRNKYLYPSQDKKKKNTLPDFSVDAEPFVFCIPAPGKAYNQARVTMRVPFAQICILQGQASKEANRPILRKEKFVGN